MTQYAHVLDGVVRGPLFTPPDGHDLAECFTPDVAAQHVPVPKGRPVAEGWTWDGTKFAAPPPASPDMPVLRQAAFRGAMTYGNAITARVVGAYSDVEARTWPLQRTQADAVLAGHDLPPDALLTKLAARRGVAIEAMATTVQHKAEAFEAIADAGVGLRLGAEGLLSPDLDTPAKLEAAVEALRVEAEKVAAEHGLAA